MVGMFCKVKRMVYRKKINDVANQLMWSSHCILHRCQLSTKSLMEKNKKLLKDLFHFLEKLFKYHHNSVVVTAMCHETVKVLGITGTTYVIQVNGTHCISHVQLALKNLLNSLSANPTKWSNTLKQFISNLPINCLSVFDHFVKLALKGLMHIMPMFSCFKITISLFFLWGE